MYIYRFAWERTHRASPKQVSNVIFSNHQFSHVACFLVSEIDFIDFFACCLFLVPEIDFVKLIFFVQKTQFLFKKSQFRYRTVDFQKMSTATGFENMQ